MKKLFALFTLLVLMASCGTTARISYTELPNKYKDIKIDKQIIVRDSHIYVTTKKGTKQKIDTRIFDFEILSKKNR